MVLTGKHLTCIAAAIVVPALVLSTAAVAAESASNNGFAAIDSNDNGRLERQEMLTAYTERFRAMDSDGDGALNRPEYRQAMAKRFPSPASMSRTERRRVGQRIDTFFARLDVDDSASISPAEYKRAMSAYFDRLDRNNDGALAADELRRAVAAPDEKSTNGA